MQITARNLLLCPLLAVLLTPALAAPEEGKAISFKSQVKELITQYGPLSVLWYDVPQEFDAVRGQGVIDHTRALQPDILINNRTGAKGDYDTPEQRVGGFNNQRPWETCMTICRQWAWKPNDEMKSLQVCLRTLINCAGGDGNLLFNVGPTPEGEIEARQVERLREMGAWLEKYGESIYGTRGGPFLPGAWGASTRKGQTIYLHVMQWPKEGLEIANLPVKIASSSLLTGGAVQATQDGKVLKVVVAEGDRSPIATIVKLELDGSAMELPPVSITPPALTSGKKASASNIFQNDKTYSPAKALDDNPQTRWATDAGTRAAWIQVDLASPTLIGRLAVSEAIAGRVRKFELQYRISEEQAWQTALTGSELGENFEADFEPVTARWVRLNILEATDGPTLNAVRLFSPRNQLP